MSRAKFTEAMKEKDYHKTM